MVVSGLRGAFLAIVFGATVLTVLAFFTPGWRFYNHVYNEGIVVHHLDDYHPFEGWEIAFLIITFIFQCITLIFILFSIIRQKESTNFTYYLRTFSIGFSVMATFTLIAGVVIYSMRYHKHYAMKWTKEHISDVTLGYSFWFVVVDLILMVIGTIVGFVSGFKKTSRT